MSSSIAGRLGQLKMSGTATTLTNAATTASGSKVYQITDATKRVLDPTFAVTVKDGGVSVDAGADPYTVNRLTGTVTFTNTGTRTITVSGKYLPMTNVAKVTDLEYTESRPLIDDTTFDSNGWQEIVAGIATIAVTLGKNWESVSSVALKAALVSGAPLALEIHSDRSLPADEVYWVLPTKQARSVKVDNLVKSSLDFVGYADADLRTVSNA